MSEQGSGAGSWLELMQKNEPSPDLAWYLCDACEGSGRLHAPFRWGNLSDRCARCGGNGRILTIHRNPPVKVHGSSIFHGVKFSHGDMTNE